MGVRGRVRGRVRAACGGTAVVALVLGSMVGQAQAAPVPATPECPTLVPAAAVTAGMVGEGETVVTGSTPEPFKVDVLGVIKDGIGAGRDLIMIKVSDLPGHSVIAQGGGIWEGMSGSPVYVDGRLLGAVSYGFTLAPSPIGGLTPASDMADVLNLSGGAATAVPTKPAAVKVPLSGAVRHSLAARAKVAAPSGSLEQLKTPLGVSGVHGAHLKRLRADTATAGLPVTVYAGGRAAAPAAGAAPSDRPVAGGNFVATLAYGDVTAAGVGTTTYVCGNKALAFGHPMEFAGPVSYGANDATSLGIVEDSSFGSFKMANIGASFGTVDQDRLAAIRANLTASPSTADIVTTVRNYDTGKTRTGTTQVAARDLLPGLLPYAVWANDDATFDEVGDGRQSAGWTISGTRAGGKPFSVSRADKWVDNDDVTFASAVDVADAADALLNNDAEKVTIDKVTYSSVISTVVKQLTLAKIEVAVNGGRYKSVKSLTLKAGDKVSVRSTVTPNRGTTPTTSVSTLTVPRSARGQSGSLSVVGGQTLADQGGDDEDDTSCLFDGDGCDNSSVTSLDSVITSITSPPRHDDLVTRLRVDDNETGDSVVAAKATSRQREVTTGRKTIQVNVRR